MSIAPMNSDRIKVVTITTVVAPIISLRDDQATLANSCFTSTTNLENFLIMFIFLRTSL